MYGSGSILYCGVQHFRLKAPLDSPLMKEFVGFLDPVNRFAEESPGFVWRLAAPNGQSSSYLPPAYEDERIVTNLTIWEDIESLRNFAYQTVHTYFLRSRKKWFEQAADMQVVLWWVHRDHRPTLEEAKQKLFCIQENGPAPEAFSFQAPFDSRGNPIKRSQD